VTNRKELVGVVLKGFLKALLICSSKEPTGMTAEKVAVNLFVSVWMHLAVIPEGIFYRFR
jgi:hypothetical protein